ncbi:MAG: hypothetical protein PHI63_05820 [Patescibacteria group bacterium]|nr:hypothetical protein [Patescibacteria group bacterium]
MSKTKALALVNALIDRMIIQGKINSPKYRRLIKLHRALIQA